MHYCDVFDKSSCDGGDLCLKLGTRPSAEAVVFRYGTVPDQVSPEHRCDPHDHDHDRVVAHDQVDCADNHGVGVVDHDAPEEDGEVKGAKGGRVEENVTWAKCVL